MATKDIKQMDLSAEDDSAADEDMVLALQQIQALDAKDVEAFVFTAKMKVEADGSPRKSDGMVPVLHGMCGKLEDLCKCLVALAERFNEKMGK